MSSTSEMFVRFGTTAPVVSVDESNTTPCVSQKADSPENPELVLAPDMVNVLQAALGQGNSKKVTPTG